MQPETIEDVLALLEERPDDAELFQLLGQMYQQADQRDKAREAYERSIALDPNDPWTHLFLGNWFFRHDMLRDALKRFNHAAELLPDEAIAYTCQGDAYRALGLNDQAELAYEMAVRVAPNDQQVKQRLSEWYEVQQSGTLVVTRAMIKDACRNHHAATTVLLAQRWLSDHPNDLGILFDYAEMLYHMTRYEEAIRVFEMTLGQHEDRGVRWAIFNQLGCLHRYRGDYVESERWFRLAIETQPEDASSYIFLGAIQARQGKLIDAEDTHRAATRCAEGLIDEAYHNLGLVLRGQDKLAESAASFCKAIEIDPSYAEAIEALDDVEMALRLSAQDTTTAGATKG